MSTSVYVKNVPEKNEISINKKRVRYLWLDSIARDTKAFRLKFSQTVRDERFSLADYICLLFESNENRKYIPAQASRSRRYPHEFHPLDTRRYAFSIVFQDRSDGQSARSHRTIGDFPRINFLNPRIEIEREELDPVYPDDSESLRSLDES